MKRILMALAAAMVAVVNVVASPQSYEEIDITAAVRAAGKGTTTPGWGTVCPGWTIDNAFWAGETLEARVLMSTKGNAFVWTIDPSYEEGKPIYVTRYSIRRTVYASGSGNLEYSQRRAPSDFRLEGSSDGTYWVVLDQRVGFNWLSDADEEKSFEVDPQCVASFRYYRFVTTNSQAFSGDACQCGFQYVRLFGSIGTDEPLLTTATKLAYLHSGNGARTFIDNYIPTLDSRLELDVALSSVSGVQCIFAAKDPGDETRQFRLFHTQDQGWWFYYGTNSLQSYIKTYAGVRNKIVVDGPVVTINGVHVFDAGEKLTSSTDYMLSIAASVDTSGNPIHFANLKIWSIKAWTAAGDPALDLKPMLHRDGTGMFYDQVGKRCYQSTGRANRLPVAFLAESDEHEITERVRAANAQTVTLVEGTAADGWGAENLFDGADATMAGRAIFADYSNIIQYDIADDYLSGSPIVVTRYALLPPVGDASDEHSASERAPIQFELQASVDGQTWGSLHRQIDGIGMGSWRRGSYGAGGVYGYNGLTFNIPEDKRGDYRHYRFVTYKSSHGGDWKTSLQAIKFYGFEGCPDPRYEPVEYVQNGADAYDGTYFLTGVNPAKADLTVELKGEFTRVDVPMGLFCCRGANRVNPWALWLSTNGKFYLQCRDASSAEEFAPVANTPYTITVKGNQLFVDGNLIGTADSTTDYTPGSEMVLWNGHVNKGELTNQARFKLTSCRILDPQGGVVRDYIPAVRTSDNVGGLFDRVNAKFLAAGGSRPPRFGMAVDTDFRQCGRSLVFENEPAENERIPSPLQFAFGENQILPEGLYAAFDNARHAGTSSNAWAKVVKLADVTNGMDSLSVGKLPNEEKYKYVKFFLCDGLGYENSSTKTYKACKMGLLIVIQ